MTLACNTVTFTPGVMNWWPPKLPDAILDYALNITPAIDPSVDFAVNANVAIAPSGAGEMAASNLYITTHALCGVTNTLLTATMTGGQPGRTYQIKFDVTMSDQRVFSFLVNQDIPVIISGVTPTVPPSADFGTPLTNTGGAGNPVISYSGTPVSPFEWTVMPNLGTYLDGVLMFSGPTVNYIGPVSQDALTSLSVANATGYLSDNSFSMSSAAMNSLVFPNMTTWVGAFAPTMAALTTLSFASLAYFNGSFTPVLNTLATLALPSLLNFAGTFNPGLIGLTAFSMNAGLRVFNSNFLLEGAKLTQASVDGILVSLSLLNGTGFTTLYSGRTINLSGGTSSAPSSVGLTAKAILVANSNSVTTN